jgi:hypothetical protein
LGFSRNKNLRFAPTHLSIRTQSFLSNYLLERFPNEIVTVMWRLNL